ncbi:hypothetical protein AWU65_01825 [Paenibacillus glucanolyticus]|jgi:hypothetical protein|uniref:Uncharacterized protein n=1 Tax=Paenibacillus glucanolyticus TaxID=59843 RepID=A0A163G639_9BACL|nr:hypothetical protein AWU65_01825 [Paenibacillus glucanolyticus]OMF64745.1 hypothetical protein BK142_31660 [Paenibacillus glucanolyticus]
MQYEPKHRYHVTFKNDNDEWKTVPISVKGLLRDGLRFLDLVNASECYVDDVIRTERIFFIEKIGANFIIQFPLALRGQSLTQFEIYQCMRY